MASLIEFYLSDFSRYYPYSRNMGLFFILGEKYKAPTRGSAGFGFPTDIAEGEFLSMVLYDAITYTSTISLYVPKIDEIEEFCLKVVRNYYNFLDSGLLSLAGKKYERKIGREQIVFSNRMYIYTENELSSDALERIDLEAKGIGVSVIIRDTKYSEQKSAETKAIAFISHDSRDKAEFARPLFSELQQKQCPIWYDEYSLKVGESLRKSIERGIKEAKKCIILITPNFLENKSWAEKEFDMIFNKNNSGNEESIFLPIWCNVTKDQVDNYSSYLSGLIALKWEDGIKVVANKLYDSLKPYIL